MLHPKRRPFQAFTLVELLVVMGIIALLVGILLPVTSRAMDSARTAACKANLRSIYQAASIYAADNKGYLPYGFYWSDTNWGSGDPNSLSNLGWVSWFTSLNKTLNAKTPQVDITNGSTRGGASKLTYELSKVFRCPAAPGFQQQVHYYQHGIAMPHLPMELKNAATRPGPNSSIVKTPIDRPARFTDLYNDNILFWDTPLLNGPTVDGRTGLPFFRSAQGEPGTANNVLPLTHIDGSQLRNPSITEFRFRDQIDRFANTAEVDFRRLDQTIFFPTDELTVRQTGGQLASTNSDPGGPDAMKSQLCGNVRFRHMKETTANVAFADGSVQSMVLNKSRKYPASGGEESYETTIKRRMIMIKWPTGVAPSGTYASN